MCIKPLKRNVLSDGLSGYGYELTMKIIRDSSSPSNQCTTWPIELMQTLARYTFENGIENLFKKIYIENLQA
jgi:hypothetical protein